MSKWIRLIASLGITVAALFWTFKDTDVTMLVASLKGARWVMLLPYLAILTFVHLARTIRWGHLLSGIERVPFRMLNEASAIGFMMLLILPLRLGEFARPILIAQRSKIRRSSAMASVVFERVIDGMFIALLLQVCLYFIPGNPSVMATIRIGANLMLFVFSGVFAALLLARWKHQLVLSLIEQTVGRFSRGLATKVIQTIDGFLDALRRLPGKRDLTLFFAWTLVYWMANVVGLTIFANAFDCGGGTVPACGPLELTLQQGTFVLGVTIVGLMIPAGPASTGTMQSFLKLGLSAFVPALALSGSGIAFANAIWLVQLLQQVLFGLIFLSLSHTSFLKLAKRLEENSENSEGQNT